MADLEKVVPEISEKRQEVAAHIKKHVHDEKYHVHFMNDLHFLRKPDLYVFPKPRGLAQRVFAYFGFIPRNALEFFYVRLKNFTKDKMQTHDGDNWGNLDRCRDWCKEYIK